MKKLAAKLCMVLVMLLWVPAAALAAAVSITCPSAQQTTLAPLRDFYVIGLISRDAPAAERPLDVRVDLYRLTGGRRLVRTVWSRVGASGLTEEDTISEDFASSTFVNNYPKTPDWKWVAPDMVYDPAGKNSFGDPRKKAVVYDKHSYNSWTGRYENGDFYAAMVQGGVTKKFTTNYTYLYGKNSDLGAGDYQLVVTAFSRRDGRDVASADMKLRFGFTSDKILARFSPDEHLKNVTEFAKKNNYCILLDKLPGYWDSFEIVNRWRPNDSAEYDGGLIRTVLYNINSSCATQTVELAYLASRGEVRSGRVRYYRYDIGDPSVAIGGVKAFGKLTPMSGAPFEIARAEYRPAGAGTADNAETSGDQAVRADFLANYGLTAREGEIVSLYGVALPLNDGAVENADCTYKVNNSVQKIRYEFLDGGHVTASFEKPLGLSRDGGKPSIYEYKHDLAAPAGSAGKELTLRMTALDARGAKVVPALEIPFAVAK